MVKLLFINASNSYRHKLPYTLSYRGPRTQLQTTRTLCTQLQSLLLLYAPKTQLYTSAYYFINFLDDPLLDIFYT